MNFLYWAYSWIWAQFFKGVKHRGGLIHEHGFIPSQIQYKHLKLYKMFMKSNDLTCVSN